MSIVSNSSPLINLACVGRLELLAQLYGEILVPEAVWNEVVLQGTGQAGAQEVREAPWIHVHSVENRELVWALRYGLDAGEAEAIALSLQVGAEMLLMDEQLGRETASHMGVPCVGLVGALIEAKQKGLVEAIAPVLDKLRDVAGFWLSEQLYQKVIRDQGEAL